MKIILSAAALMVCSLAFSQNDYVVTLKNDTIAGEIRILSYDLMDRVQLGSGRSKKMFTAVQLRAAHQGVDTYTPVKFDNTIRMMKVIKSGFLSLYGFRQPNQTGYDGRIIAKMGNNPMELPNLGFKKMIGNLIEDCPEVADQVKNGTLGRNEVEKIIDDYNICKDATRERRFDNITAKVSNGTTDFIDELRERVNASDFTTKTEINDLLNNIADKVKKKETVPAYMKDGLKGYLSAKPEFKEDADQLIMLLEN